MTPKGLMVCLTTMVSWALLIVISKGLLVRYNLDPWIFTIIQLMFGGVFLVCISGSSATTLIALRSPYTWAYGVARVLSAACFTASLLYISAANAGFFGLVSIPFSALMFVLLFSRKPSVLELPGHIIIVAGMVLLISTLENTFSNPAVYLMLLSEAAVVSSVIIAEFHPQNQGDSLKERASLSGVMLLASAFTMLVTLAALSLLTGATEPATTTPQVVDWKQSIPLIDLSQVWSLKMWIAAIAVGVTLRGTSMFLSMQAISLVGGQNYVATIAALPFTSLLFERVADVSGYLPQHMPDPLTVLAGVIMTCGSLSIMWARQHKLKTAAAIL
ncbi:hypothetical protein PsAD2_02767 [Pseudovibrio axinellae]|uniref:EamA domain-containing protein n=1 Tax=Pseudovibrio axinellae TaxID=989403 RepID=A0A165XTV5_9HYPH|nr:EamA family transporter [Pseudovibrio axinellae]KZL18033.1 hypothetical protein PsAD2_02767 [Pseudovibrio axinellae]SER12812.1 EamA-like transporter family protein [Pseudovibrio axinellae]